MTMLLLNQTVTLHVIGFVLSEDAVFGRIFHSQTGITSGAN